MEYFGAIEAVVFYFWAAYDEKMYRGEREKVKIRLLHKMKSMFRAHKEHELAS